ncbi:FF domain-containing protein [Pochonia chlamydosporia 170]|uniref:FF domain-containing protein n=1 Tax=Pochonia chlamydosporia 170 TaxID=1380566 RepID=A0A179G8Y5_METCM|nr:FF domain-containing protein [Pochonia chlamydosporia 170]OAQ74275.1 FF domain-containing protein [Pochonia chlamydosporia 170]
MASNGGLKSTYKPSAAAVAASAPLPPGWTEHTAPTGHKYYYNASTKESTYQRPGVPPPAPEPVQDTYSPYANFPSLADPRVANAYLAQLNPQNQSRNRGGHSGRGGRGSHEGRPKPQPIDKPRKAEKIPGCEPWMLVYTKYSRRFAYNPVKNASYWRIPERLMEGILELDKARIRAKAAGESDEMKEEKATSEKPAPQIEEQQDYDSDEYEEVEVEVTDDEGGDDLNAEHPSKRRRTYETADNEDDAEEEEDVEEAEGGPVEFTEADIAAQLQAMGEEYGLEPGDYDDGNMESWPEGTEGVDFSEEDAKFLFKDLLNDYNINPYSPWDKLLEEGKVMDDPRYTALATTRARKECWDEWTREKIAELKELRAKQEKKDPKIGYMAFLQEKATPKLYWPEFKRKYKKEDVMKDMKLSDKDREKAYRDHINRLKLPQTKLKSDLTALLKAQPVHLLNNKSSPTNMPPAVLTDLRYISLEPKIRDPLVEAYIQTLPPAPEDVAAAEEDEERKKAREARGKREKALEERNRVVEEQKRRRERDLMASKARLRDEERELEVAMRVGKRGLQSQLQEEA